VRAPVRSTVLTRRRARSAAPPRLAAYERHDTLVPVLLEKWLVMGPRNSSTRRLTQLLFRDRTEAGRTLAMSLTGLKHEGPIVVGVAGGGIVVAAEVSRALEAPLEPWGSEGPRGGPGRLRLGGAAVIVVDEGIETGATVRAVLAGVKNERPRYVVLAVPVGPASVLEALQREVDGLVCLTRTDVLAETAAWYQEFPPVSAQEIADIIDERARTRFRRPA
jgi:predicted phosphoribosyltransferase